MKLWQLSTTGRSDTESYTVGDDYLIDRKILFWDCLGSVAHARMLQKIGILSAVELAALTTELRKIAQAAESGLFEITPADEDCHTAIERALTEKLGEAGKKIHTARSRNDQVLTALRLFMKRELLQIGRLALNFGRELLKFAEKFPAPVAGFSHTQRAMPSTFALWAGAFAESMTDNIRQLASVLDQIDSSPLGSAAGYGVSIPIDREFSAALLGFARTQRNVLYVQNSRGKTESLVLGVCAEIMADLNKLASDLIFFSLPELGYVKLSPEFCTGSSIMPQKRNPDVLELMRAKSKVVSAKLFEVHALRSDLISGYNRDNQLMKRPLIDGLEITASSLAIIAPLLASTEVDAARAAASLTPEVFATDRAYELVAKGVPFRDAYRQVKQDLESGKSAVIESKKTHYGAPQNPGLADAGRELESCAADLAGRSLHFEQAVRNLIEK